jgi:diaminopimelate decarboxylase
MSSNYNSRGMAAEVMVRGDQFAVVRERQTIDQLIANEVPEPQWTAAAKRSEAA